MDIIFLFQQPLESRRSAEQYTAFSMKAVLQKRKNVRDKAARNYG